jgi:hypothetical protein
MGKQEGTDIHWEHSLTVYMSSKLGILLSETQPFLSFLKHYFFS